MASASAGCDARSTKPFTEAVIAVGSATGARTRRPASAGRAMNDAVSQSPRPWAHDVRTSASLAPPPGPSSGARAVPSPGVSQGPSVVASSPRPCAVSLQKSAASASRGASRRAAALAGCMAPRRRRAALSPGLGTRVMTRSSSASSASAFTRASARSPAVAIVSWMPGSKHSATALASTSGGSTPRAVAAMDAVAFAAKADAACPACASAAGSMRSSNADAGRDFIGMVRAA